MTVARSRPATAAAPAHADALPATDTWFGQLDELAPARRSAPPARPVADQAQGLRQLFTPNVLRCIPVVSNPMLGFGGALLERLCTAYAMLGLSTLVVDAGERARAPHELAGFDLTEGIEALSPQVSYLAARGLSLRYVDATGSTSSFLDALAEAAPDAHVVLVHAGAAELARLFGRRMQELQAQQLRPIVLCDEHPESITHAYGAIKLLALRARLMAHDLLISAQPGSPRAARVADRVARCADDFLGAVLHDWVALDPTDDPLDAPGAHLVQLARAQFDCALQQPRLDSGFAALTGSAAGAWHGAQGGRRAALPAQPHALGPRGRSLR